MHFFKFLLTSYILLIAKIDSIEPAPPKQCPIAPLLAVTETLLICSLLLSKRFSIALASHKSPTGVDVACTLIEFTSDGFRPK